MNSTNYRDALVRAMKELAKEGFKCFILKPDANFMYGYVITPSDNVLYVQMDLGGWTASLKYVPSHEHGQGCMCTEEPFAAVTKAQMLKCEQLGLSFAMKLRAKLYKSSAEYTAKLWNKDSFEEVTGD